MTFCSSRSGCAGSGFFSASSLATAYFTIFLSMVIFAMYASRARPRALSELAVIAFLERVEQIPRGVHLAVVHDLVVSFRVDRAAVREREAIRGFLEILFLSESC